MRQVGFINIIFIISLLFVIIALGLLFTSNIPPTPQNIAIIIATAFGIFVLLKLVLVAKYSDEESSGINQRICTQCLTTGQRIKVYPGSGWITLFLFALGVLPGLIYSTWRMSAVKKVCPCCGNTTMIPISSPNGQQLSKKVKNLEKMFNALGH
jgi:hypothetical protein